MISPSAGVDKKLAVVLSHPTQYYSPWFQWLRAHSQIQFRVFYLWDFGVTDQIDPKFGKAIRWDVDLLSGYDSEFVPNESRSPGAESFFGFKNPDIAARLKAYGPSAILLFGYKWATHIRVVMWARTHRIPIVFRGDSNLDGRPSPPLHVQIPLRLLFAQMDAFVYVGIANRDYFRRFGVPQKKLFFSPHSVNGAFFKPDETSNAKALDLRRQLGLQSSTKIILFAGKLVPEKGPVTLLRAYSELEKSDTALVIVGDGSEKSALSRLHEEHPVKVAGCSVHFLPFANQSLMPSIYSMADVFVLPSEGLWETWGLAINEAMHMGIPCIVSDRVGCRRDLVTEGETGWVFTSGDVESLKAALCRALDALNINAQKYAIAAAVKDRISGYNYQQTTDGLLSALSSLDF